MPLFSSLFFYSLLWQAARSLVYPGACSSVLINEKKKKIKEVQLYLQLEFGMSHGTGFKTSGVGMGQLFEPVVMGI